MLRAGPPLWFTPTEVEEFRKLGVDVGGRERRTISTRHWPDGPIRWARSVRTAGKGRNRPCQRVGPRYRAFDARALRSLAGIGFGDPDPRSAIRSR